jgi:hypothetical protein
MKWSVALTRVVTVEAPSEDEAREIGAARLGCLNQDWLVVSPRGDSIAGALQPSFHEDQHPGG